LYFGGKTILTYPGRMGSREEGEGQSF